MKPVLQRMAIAGVALAYYLSPTHADAACATSAASLNGWYALFVTGTTLPSTPKFLAGALLFDGVGTFTANNIYNGNAVSSAAGTYVLNTDCTLTLSLTLGSATPPQVYTVAVTTSNEAVGIEVDSSAVAAIDLQAQYASLTRGLNFNISSANGLFNALCYGAPQVSADLNIVTFNNGTISGTDPYNNDFVFQVANNPYSGTYTVNTDGTFSGTLTVGGEPFAYFGVISSSGTEVEYYYADVNSSGNVTTAFESCVAKF